MASDPISAAGKALVMTVPGRFMLFVCVCIGINTISKSNSVSVSSGGATNNGLSIIERPDSILMRWSGNVDKRMTKELSRAFHTFNNDGRRIVLSLNSDGGRVDEGEKIIERIKRLRATRTVDTTVEDGRHCASMCVPIYVTGGNRTAHPRARFMFHSVRVRAANPFFSPSAKQIQKIEERATEDLFDDHLRASGVNERWLENLRLSMGGADVWFSAKELHQKRVGLVDELEQETRKR